jgi:alpha-ketoglutarate-dependent taurine dioxygenase
VGPPQTRFAIRALTPCLGVEVQGFVFATDPDPAEVRDIQALADHHHVLLFRDQSVSEDAHVAFSKVLGKVIEPVEPTLCSATNPLILHLGNVDSYGNKLALDAPGTLFTYAPEKWHSDGSYKPQPNYLTILHALEIPPEGGETWFASLVAAYEALPEKTKVFIANKAMEHPYPNSGKNLGGMTGRKLDVVIHPLVRELMGGQKALLFSAFGGHIIGMDPDESDTLVKDLLELATGGEFTYKHQWRLGDTLIWNNRGVMHTGRPWDRVRHRRLLQRTELSGEHG